MALTPPVFRYYSALVLRHQPEQSLVWDNPITNYTVLTVFMFLRACWNGTVGFECPHKRMCHKRQGVLVPLVPRFASASMR